MFDLFISLYLHILISLGSCALACTLASSHHYILMFVCTGLYPRILTSSYLQVHVPSGLCVQLLVTSYLHILLSLGSCTPGACWYPRILTSSYPQIDVLRVLVGILVSSHPHILRFIYSGFLLVSSHPHIFISLGSYTPGTCCYPRILTSSYLYVHVLRVLIGNLASSYPQVLVFALV